MTASEDKSVETSLLSNSSVLFAEEVYYQPSYDLDSYFEMEPKRDSLKIVIPVTIVYGLIFITGVIGNISTCIVIKKNRSMHTATNYYLFSLAISDFLLLLSGVPQEVYLTWSKYPYVFGEYFCIGRGILAEMSANATVLTITAFTVERYVAICHPFLGHAISKLSRAIRIIVLIWLLSILTAVPQALQFGIISYNGIEKCVVVRVIIEHSFQLSTYIFFFAPMSIIFVLYFLIGINLYRSNLFGGGGGYNAGDSKDAQNFRNHDISAIALNAAVPPHIRRGRFGIKSTQSDTILYRYSGGNPVSTVTRGRINQFGTKRVLKMLVAVVICFFICWAPFHAQRLIAVYGPSVMAGNTDEEQMEATTLRNSNFNVPVKNKTRITDNSDSNHEIIYTVLTYVSGVLYYLSTCINPLLYNLMSNKFRQAFKSILFRQKSNNIRRSQNSHRTISRKPTINSNSTSTMQRDSSESEIQSKVSLLQTVLNERQINTTTIP